ETTGPDRPTWCRDDMLQSSFEPHPTGVIDMADVVRPVPGQTVQIITRRSRSGAPQVVVAGLDMDGADDEFAEAALRGLALQQLIGGCARLIDGGQSEFDAVDRLSHAHSEAAGGVGGSDSVTVDVGEQEPFGHTVGGV